MDFIDEFIEFPILDSILLVTPNRGHRIQSNLNVELSQQSTIFVCITFMSVYIQRIRVHNTRVKLERMRIYHIIQNIRDRSHSLSLGVITRFVIILTT